MRSLWASLLFLLCSTHITCEDPGYPFENPTISYWQLPENKDVAEHRSETFPTEVDVVIIGSGISGTSVAWHLLRGTNGTVPLRIAMLEARKTCSGATGRNGGHIRPSSYSEYTEAKELLNQDQAAKITRLRAAHVDALIAAADILSDKGSEAAQARPVDSLDVFFDRELFQQAVAALKVLKVELPDIGKEWSFFEQEQAREISLMPEAVGILVGTAKVAGAIWPYRFVTHSLKALLDEFDTFSLDTNTTAQNVSIIGTDAAANSSDPGFAYEVETSRGIITAKHVVHASNAWVPQFVPGLRGKLFGGRLHMSAQRGGAGLPDAGHWPAYSGNGSLPGGRAWSLFRDGLDYIVQNPQDGTLMFGGDGGLTNDSVTAALNPYDDSALPNHGAASYLNGALPNYFGYNTWGIERIASPQTEDAEVFPGRTKRVWTGIEGLVSDGRPLVGRLPVEQTCRAPAAGGEGREWVAAAFNGEGMAYAWLCGRALSAMLVADQVHPSLPHNDPALMQWFPESFLVTNERIAAILPPGQGSESGGNQRLMRRHLPKRMPGQ